MTLPPAWKRPIKVHRWPWPSNIEEAAVRVKLHSLYLLISFHVSLPSPPPLSSFVFVYRPLWYCSTGHRGVCTEKGWAKQTGYKKSGGGKWGIKYTLCWPAKWPGETEEAGGTMENRKIWHRCKNKGMRRKRLLDMISELASHRLYATCYFL